MLVMVAGFACFVVSSLLIYGVRSVTNQKMVLASKTFHLHFYTFPEQVNLHPSMDCRNHHSDHRRIPDFHCQSCQSWIHFSDEGNWLREVKRIECFSPPGCDHAPVPGSVNLLHPLCLLLLHHHQDPEEKCYPVPGPWVWGHWRWAYNKYEMCIV